jgi:SAM-dependent methyltransferase
MMSSALGAVTNLKIADQLAATPKPVAELARTAGVKEDILYRALRALAPAGIFQETAPRVFANTPSSDVLREDHPQSVRDMVIWMTDRFHFDNYRDMLPTMRDGRTAVEHVFKRECFDAIFADELVAREFNNAMTNLSAMVIPAVLEIYDFSGIGTLADVAGGHGFVLTAILEKYPQMKGILFDLDHVVEGAKPRIQKMGLGDRVRLTHGDFFKEVPAADAYVMKHIIHDWDDEKAVAVLKNCAKHLPPKGRVILLEAVLSPGNEPHFGKLLDIEMFMLPGGRERTEAEFRDLFAKAGLQLARVVPTKSPLSVVEAAKS